MEQKIMINTEIFINIITKYYKFKHIKTNYKRDIAFVRDDGYYLNITNVSNKYELIHCPSDRCGILNSNTNLSDMKPLFEKFPNETRSYKISKILEK